MNQEPATTEAAKPVPQQLTEADRLSIENIYLKLQNMQLQVQNLDNVKAQVVTEMRKLQQEMEEKKVALSAKYGVDITSTTVTPDGTIVRPPTNGS